jgi:hypothetical protein
MLGSNKTRVVLVVDKYQSHSLDAWAHQFGWSKSKTGAMALRIGIAQLAWAYEILHKRWDRATAQEKSEALHWLQVAEVIPYELYEKLDDEIDLTEQRKAWREAAKSQERLVSGDAKRKDKANG